MHTCLHASIIICLIGRTCGFTGLADVPWVRGIGISCPRKDKILTTGIY